MLNVEIEAIFFIIYCSLSIQKTNIFLKFQICMKNIYLKNTER